MGLYKRKDSHLWWMSFRIDGRRIFESTGCNNKKLAERIHAKRLIEIQESRFQENTRPEGKTPFSELEEKYRVWAERQKGIRQKKGFLKQLLAAFGSLQLKAFTTQLVEGYQSKLLAKRKKPATANRHVACLKHMFTKAEEWELIDDVMLKRVRRVKLLRENNRRLRYLSKVECAALLDACDQHLKPIVTIALNTGMRRGEILGLEWNRHVDLRHDFILLDQTKNGERREIPINQTLRSTLQGLVRHIKSPYVFTDLEGRRFKDVKKSFRSACRRAVIERCPKCSYEGRKTDLETPGNCILCGTQMERRCIEDFRFHDLRHTAASHMIMAGVDIVTIKEILGHKTMTMTLRYAHLAPSHKKKAVEALENGYVLVTVKEKGATGKPVTP